MQLTAMKNSFRISNPPPDEQNEDVQSHEVALCGEKSASGTGFANAGGEVEVSGRSDRTGGIIMTMVNNYNMYMKESENEAS